MREFAWDPMKWRLPIPPRVVDAMDEAQKWAIACTREALEDYGYPKRPLDIDRTAVILGNAMGGEKHYLTVLRVYFPEYARELAESASFAALPEAVRRDITRELHDRMGKLPSRNHGRHHARRIGQLHCRPHCQPFQFPRPQFHARTPPAHRRWRRSARRSKDWWQNDFDVAVTGGIDRNMGASTFVKFCKIGALSATGTRPYAEGADGFVMGEGAAIFLLKRLADAERDGDKIYAVLRGMGGSSDGKGVPGCQPATPGQVYAPRLNQFPAVWLPSIGLPIRSGAWSRPMTPEPVPEGSPPSKYGVRNGPLCHRKMLESCQPPTSASATGFICDPNCRPWPTGSS